MKTETQVKFINVLEKMRNGANIEHFKIGLNEAEKKQIGLMEQTIRDLYEQEEEKLLDKVEEKVKKHGWFGFVPEGYCSFQSLVSDVFTNDDKGILLAYNQGDYSDYIYSKVIQHLVNNDYNYLDLPEK